MHAVCAFSVVTIHTVIKTHLINIFLKSASYTIKTIVLLIKMKVKPECKTHY